MTDKPKKDELVLVDEQGNRAVFDVLFTFHSDAFDKSYVLLYPRAEANQADIGVQAFSFDSDDEGAVAQAYLHEIKTDAEWNMVQAVLNTIMSDERLNGETE
ncbi:MAG: DUF1292 domain-containing protein [Lactobacillus sp.]